MNGWLIYDRAGAERNAWFIHRLIEKAKEYGLDLQLKLSSALDLNSPPAFAIVRTIDCTINLALEAQGVRVFNNYQTAKTANDKWETYQVAKSLGIPVMDTALAEDGIGRFSYPCVLKSREGHGGSEVFLVKNEEEARERFLELQAIGKSCILQKKCACAGKDVRVYVIGGEIVAAVLRSSDCDFRSNFSLGGKVEPFAPTLEQRKIVKTLHEHLKTDYVGVDFIEDESGWVLNEIEDSAGARMLYSCTEIDIIEKFVFYLADRAGMR